jgi:DNA-binding response OmpR family regulator
MKKRILVVDDDSKIVLVLQIRLRSAGYEVLSAPDGVSGLILAKDYKPDLVILDIMMPRGGGFSMAYRLREEAPEVPFIFITASKEKGLKEMADSLGAAGYLEKPYEKDDLLEAVAKVLAAGQSLVAGPPQQPKTEFPAPEPPAPAPTTPENALDLRLANLNEVSSTSNAQKSQPEPVGITGRNMILIVEDDRAIAMALTTRLQFAGHEVIQAFDAISGVEAAIKRQPGLILMDITLPGGSGLIAAQRIQSMVPKPMPIIFLTASQQPGLRQKALALGAAGFLQKPYDPQELLSTIQKALPAAVGKPPGSTTPAPATPENALDLRLANLRMTSPSSDAPKSQPKRVGIIGRNKILIVSDDRRIAMASAAQLQNAGQEVIQACDEMSGVQAATKHQPDLILMDVNLAGGSGLIVAQRIQSVVLKLTPMIFLTAGQQPELRQQALALGAADFLEKSCDPGVLLRTIQDALSLGRGDDPTTKNPGFF